MQEEEKNSVVIAPVVDEHVAAGESFSSHTKPAKKRHRGKAKVRQKKVSSKKNKGSMANGTAGGIRIGGAGLAGLLEMNSERSGGQFSSFLDSDQNQKSNSVKLHVLEANLGVNSMGDSKQTPSVRPADMTDMTQGLDIRIASHEEMVEYCSKKVLLVRLACAALLVIIFAYLFSKIQIHPVIRSQGL